MAEAPAARVALMWSLQSQFAGYVVAGETELPGLELLARAPGRSPIMELVEGRAEYGIVSPAHMLAAGTAGRELVLVALFMPRSPVRMVGLRERVGDELRPDDGVRIGVWSGEDLELRAMLTLAGFDLDAVSFIPVGDEAGALVAGEVDYVQATTYNELPVIAAAAGGEGRLAIHDPESWGVDAPKDGLVVRREMLERDRSAVARVVRGATAGWRSVLSDPDAAAAAVCRAQPDLDPGEQRVQLGRLIELFDSSRELGRPAESDVERARHAARSAGDARADAEISVEFSLWERPGA